jgi:hypothetical protein
MTGRFSPNVAPLWTLLLALPLAGCGERDAIVVPGEAEHGATSSGFHADDVQDPMLGRLLTILHLDTTDPNQWYADGTASPWFQYSTVTHAESFSVRVTNRGPRAVQNVRLLVAVPGDLPDFGWSVTVNGVIHSSLDDFKYTRLLEGHYPFIPHLVYPDEGNGRFLVVQGPKVLPKGKTWEVPVELERGNTPNFVVHFDATGRLAFSGPRADVTAQPPFEDSGERAAPGGIIR